jgi:hypothetical protein
LHSPDVNNDSRGDDDVSIRQASFAHVVFLPEDAHLSPQMHMSEVRQVTTLTGSQAETSRDLQFQENNRFPGKEESYENNRFLGNPSGKRWHKAWKVQNMPDKHFTLIQDSVGRQMMNDTLLNEMENNKSPRKRCKR